MSEEIVFYPNPASRARMVHWMLEETGAPYRMELLSFDKRENKKPEFLAVNPMGKLPAIVHRGTVITECGAIIRATSVCSRSVLHINASTSRATSCQHS